MSAPFLELDGVIIAVGYDEDTAQSGLSLDLEFDETGTAFIALPDVLAKVAGQHLYQKVRVTITFLDEETTNAR